MAQGFTLVCSSCDRSLEVWSDGNPYYFDENGKKQYAYHPDHEHLALCVGNDSPHLCLSCGKEVLVDSEAPLESCPSCGAGDLVDSLELSGCRCPFCRNGHFEIDRESVMIS